MQRFILSVAGLTALLVTAAIVYESSTVGHAKVPPGDFVVNAPPSEHHLLKQVEIASCRDEALAGQDKTLASSFSRLERQDLAQKTSLVVQYCRCKFAGTEAFITKRELVTQWLSASAAFSDPFPRETRAKLDQVAEDCALQYGLHI